MCKERGAFQIAILFSLNYVQAQTVTGLNGSSVEFGIDYTIIDGGVKSISGNPIMSSFGSCFGSVSVDTLLSTCDTIVLKAIPDCWYPTLTWGWTEWNSSTVHSGDSLFRLPTSIGALNITVTVMDSTGQNGGWSIGQHFGGGLHLYYKSSFDVTCQDEGLATMSANGHFQPFVYVWDTGDSSQFIFPKTPGDYIVTVTDAIGCTLVDTLNVGGMPMLSITTRDQYGTFEDTSFVGCYGDASQLEIEASSDAQFTLNGNGNILGWAQNFPNRADAGALEGFVTYTATDSVGCSVSDTVWVEIPDSLEADLDITSFNEIDVNPSGGTAPYAVLLNGYSVGLGQFPLAPMNSGPQIVTVTDANGCTAIDTIMWIATSTHQVEVATAKVFPNPTNGQLNVEVDFFIENIKVFDITGRLIQEEFNVNQIYLNQDSGIYVIHVIGSSGERAVSRVTVQK